MLKTTLKKILRILPFKKELLQYALHCPIYLKNSYTFRIFCFLYNNYKNEIGASNIVTNYGINQKLKVVLDLNNSNNCLFPHFIFGNPMLYYGERGALYLSQVLMNICDTFIDIGANYGYFTFFLHYEYQNKKIIFFEPNHQLFKLITTTIKNNKILNVKGYEKAVGDITGKANFWINLDDNSKSSLTNLDSAESALKEIVIDSTRFDDFVKSESGNFNYLVKVDIENGEFLFMRGAKESLKKLNYLIIEILGPAFKEEYVQIIIRDFGFHAYYINDFTLEHFAPGQFKGARCQYNWLFCRQSPDALRNLLKQFSNKFKIHSGSEKG